MVYSSYVKQRVLFYHAKGYKAPTTANQEQVRCTRVGIAYVYFLKTFEETGNISRRAGSGRPSKITAEIKQILYSGKFSRGIKFRVFRE